MTKKCRISIKRAHYHSIKRNDPENIENRFNWVVRWTKTDVDYMSNYISIDEAAFHINMKQTMA
jgi:hypothetical protein